MSDSVRPHRWQPTGLPCPWDSPGKNTGVGCHFLLQCMKVKSESEVVQSCPTPSDPMDCSPPGSSIHGIFQARVLEWGAIAFPISLLDHLFITRHTEEITSQMKQSLGWGPKQRGLCGGPSVLVEFGTWHGGKGKGLAGNSEALWAPPLRFSFFLFWLHCAACGVLVLCVRAKSLQSCLTLLRPYWL